MSLCCKFSLSAGLSGFLIKQYDSPLPALVSWWDGSAAGILDVSNEAAVQWFLGKLKYLHIRIFSANSNTVD
jgi:hypothetical protein